MKIVKQITLQEAKPFILFRHYAKVVPNVCFVFGLFSEEGILQGICSFGKPASPAPCNGVCGKEYSKYVYELNRLALNEPHERNDSSFFISECFKLLKELVGKLIIISWSDTGQGHIGYVYQATNWIYTGCSKLRTDPFTNGKHPRHQKNLDFSIRQIRHPKHRYVYFIGNKTEKKEFVSNMKWESLNYPKGDSKKTEGVNI